MNILELVNYFYLIKGNRECLNQCTHIYRSLPENLGAF